MFIAKCDRLTALWLFAICLPLLNCLQICPPSLAFYIIFYIFFIFFIFFIYFFVYFVYFAYSCVAGWPRAFRKWNWLCAYAACTCQVMHLHRKLLIVICACQCLGYSPHKCSRSRKQCIFFFRISLKLSPIYKTIFLHILLP